MNIEKLLDEKLKQNPEIVDAETTETDVAYTCVVTFADDVKISVDFDKVIGTLTKEEEIEYVLDKCEEVVVENHRNYLDNL